MKKSNRLLLKHRLDFRSLSKDDLLKIVAEEIELLKIHNIKANSKYNYTKSRINNTRRAIKSLWLDRYNSKKRSKIKKYIKRLKDLK